MINSSDYSMLIRDIRAPQFFCNEGSMSVMTAEEIYKRGIEIGDMIFCSYDMQTYIYTGMIYDLKGDYPYFVALCKPPEKEPLQTVKPSKEIAPKKKYRAVLWAGTEGVALTYDGVIENITRTKTEMWREYFRSVRDYIIKKEE